MTRLAEPPRYSRDMSEQLFPDAATVAPVATSRGRAEAVTRPRRRLGTASFVLGLVSVLGDLLIVIAGALTVANVETATDSGLVVTVLVVIGAIGAFWGGLLCAILGIVFGIMSLARRQARGLAVAGIVLSAVTAAVNITLGVALLVDPAQLSELGSLLS